MQDMQVQDVCVGLKWTGRHGEREVVSQTKDDRFLIQEPHLKCQTVLSASSILVAMRQDALEVERQKILAEEHRLRQEVKDREQAAFDASPLGRFLASLSPLQAGKARKALAVQMRYRGEVMTRQEIVDKLLAAGATVSSEGRLITGENTFLDAQSVTQTAINYARFRVSSASTNPEQI